jgi:acetylglutamate kinase
MQRRIIAVKIGGSTLGNHDSTLEDMVELQKQGKSLVVVHGGAEVASGGMVPKMEASLRALTTTRVVRTIDGRVTPALPDNIAGKARQTKQGGTTNVSE